MTKEILNTLQSIRQRRTLKVTSEQALPIKPLDEELIYTLISSAFYAPHHYPCSANHQKHLPSPLPWRFYVLCSETCRQLAAKITTEEIPAGKIIGMLNSADYLIQSTWCPFPNTTQQDELFAGNLINMEQIAASGAAIQNLLLTATALGYENYWSSGGILRNQPISGWLTIPETEILLGSLFIFPNTNDLQANEENTLFATPSKRRNNRGNINDSYRIIKTLNMK